jgi:hypothetical protein
LVLPNDIMQCGSVNANVASGDAEDLLRRIKLTYAMGKLKVVGFMAGKPRMGHPPTVKLRPNINHIPAQKHVVRIHKIVNTPRMAGVALNFGSIHLRISMLSWGQSQVERIL